MLASRATTAIECEFAFVANGFNPTVEVPVCGHTSVTMHYIRAQGVDECDCLRQLSDTKVIQVDVEQVADGVVWMWMRQNLRSSAMCSTRRNMAMEA
ncbi:hypothetical protein [Lysobacter sp. CA196]|uniref:hypothetical protein n=1 Tax=Lysobacter sp. CA196 TaxID=3455606 RepID=UPI003F8D0704